MDSIGSELEGIISHNKEETLELWEEEGMKYYEGELMKGLEFNEEKLMFLVGGCMVVGLRKKPG